MLLHLYSKYRIKTEAQAREFERVQVLQRRRQRQAQLGILPSELPPASDTNNNSNRGHQYDEVALLKFFNYDTVRSQEPSKKPKMLQRFRSKPKLVAVKVGGITSDDEDWCSICLEGYKEGEITCTPKTGECNHIFHKKCLFAWVKKNHSECPECRCVFIT